MSRRTDRVASLIRDVVGELVQSKLSDPRVDPARTSITRVEVSEELTSAKVFISVMGTEAEARTTVRALQHAAGRLQERMMQKVRLRNTPVLSFHVDVSFKKTLETLNLISRATEEIREKEEARAAKEAEEKSNGAEQEG